MQNIEIHLDQLDILSTYMKYWIEFKDKERVRLEKVLKKEMPSINECTKIVNFAFGDSDMETTVSVQRFKPLEFENITGTLNKLTYKIGAEKAKQSVINSIQKFV